MSVWEQRTSQLRRHRQTSSREIVFNSTGEEDGLTAPAQTQQDRPLSLHRKAMEHKLSGSLKDTQASVPPMSEDIPLDAAFSGDIPGPPESVLVPESLDPTNVTPPDAAVSEVDPEPVSESGTPATNGGRNNGTEHRSPRLNGDHQHRPVKKFRPPENLDTLTPEMGGHGGTRGRRAMLHCDHQSGARSQGSSTGNGGHMGGHSVNREWKRNPGKVEDKEAEDKKEDEESKRGESR